MGLEPYALSVHHFISSVGADAGFASIIGLAVLVLLYFAQARETASLRDQAELAAQRVAQLESRLQQAVAARPSGPAVAPAPGVQPVPGTMPTGGYQPIPGVGAAPYPAPPAGVGAPPLSAATKLIPTPPAVGVAAAAPAAPAPGAPGLTSSPVSAPAANRIVTPRPATAAGAGVPTNGVGEHPVLPPPTTIPPRPPVQIRPGGSGAGRPPMLAELDDGGGRSPSDLTRILTALAAVAVVAAIVIVLLSVTSGTTNTSHPTSHPAAPVTNVPAVHHRAAKKPAVNDASVSVGVLNGTAVAGLAKFVADELGSAGFKQGAITNAATQTQPSTTVEYVPGDQRDATAVAKALKVSSSAVQPITPDTQALGCLQASSCSVVVTVGADLASTQTQPAG
jgi:hypothetical protein